MPSVSLKHQNVYPSLKAKEASKVTQREILGEKGFVGSNATSSLKDEIFEEFRDHTLTAKDKKVLSDKKLVLKKSIDAIEQHFEKRVSLFFMQAVNCFKLDCKIEEGHTIHQGFHAHTVGSLKFNAAHHATTPCLYVTDKATKNKTVFLYRSSIYDESNATIDIIKQVNKADSAIDGNTKSIKLRTKSIKLLNKTARSELTPPEATLKFIKQLIKQIDLELKENPKDKVKDVLRIYRKKASELEKWINNPANIDLWLNLQIENPKLLEEGVTYKELIRMKVAAFPLSVYNKLSDEEDEVCVPKNFYDLFYYSVLKEFDDKELRTLEEAVGVNFEELEERVDNLTSTGKAKALIKEQKKEVGQLVEELGSLVGKKQNALAKEKLLDEVMNTKNDCLRSLLYRFKYEMIAADQKAQSNIKSRIENVLNDIKGNSLAHNFDDFFYYTLLKKLKSKSKHLSVAKLFNVSYQALKQKVREVRINENFHKIISSSGAKLSKLSCKINNTYTNKKLKDKINKVVQEILDDNNSNLIADLCYLRLYDMLKDDDNQMTILKGIVGSRKSIKKRLDPKIKTPTAENIILKQDKQLNKLVNNTKDDIDELNNIINKLKGELLKELRKANGMDENSFLKKYNSKSSSSPKLDLEDLQNLESGQDSFTSKIIKKIAAIFEINPSLFYSGHFSESDG